MKKIILVLVLIGFVMACTSSSDEEGDIKVHDNFDRAALLTHLADNIIIPAYQDLDTKLGNLKSVKETFITTPNQTNLDALRASWIAAYKSWQHVEMFNIGKAEELLYVFQMNVYPTNTIDIETNISSGIYNLSSVNNNDAVGFPAVDYLLYGVAVGDVAILEKYEDVKYRNYLSDVINQMELLTETVLNNWLDIYKTEFISRSENTSTSSLNKLVNDFIYYYEKGLRANKLGIPAGVFSVTALPDRIEAFYNKEISKELLLEALDAVQDLFNGQFYNSNSTGSSLESYLIHLGKTDLANLINERLDNAREQIEILNSNFSSQILTDNTKMLQAYDALQLVVISLKVDMLQAFNVSVDFVDADGD